MKDRMVDDSWEKIVSPDGRWVRFISPETIDAASGIRTQFTKRMGGGFGMQYLTRDDKHPVSHAT